MKELATLSQVRMTRSVRHALAILRAFRPESPALGVSELSRQLDLDKSTVSRLLATLEEERMVQKDPASDKYRLGLGIVELAGVVLNELDLRRVAAPYLLELRLATRETINLGIWDGGEIAIVEHLSSPERIKYVGSVGERRPLHCSSLGKAMLSYAEPTIVRSTLRAGLAAYTTRTIVDPDRLVRELDESRRRGYAVNQGEYTEGLSAVAAPFWKHPGELAGAVSVAGPSFRFTPERLAQFGELVKQAAVAISRQLGAPPPPAWCESQAASQV